MLGLILLLYLLQTFQSISSAHCVFLFYLLYCCCRFANGWNGECPALWLLLLCLIFIMLILSWPNLVTFDAITELFQGVEEYNR